MKKRLLQTVFIGLFTILVGMSFPLATQAQELPTLTETVKYDFEGKTIYGSAPLVQSFTLSEPATVSDFDLTLKLVTSPTILPDNAFITIRFNDQVIASQRLTIGGESTITVKIPAKFAKEINTLTIAGVLKSSELICELTDEVNWAVLQAGSQLTYTYKEQPQISRWFSQLQDQNQTFHVATPETMSEFNYEQLVNLTAVISQTQQKNGQQPKIDVVTQKQIDKTKNYLLVGTIAEIEKLGKLQYATPSERQGLAENGGMAFVQVDGQWHLALISENPEQLLTLVNTLEFPDVLKQIQTPSYVLQPTQPRQLDELPKTGTLVQVGYENVQVRGRGDQVMTYFMPTPLREEVTEVKFAFAYRNSEQIDPRQSYVEIVVNQTIIRTLPLVATEAIQMLEFVLPQPVAEQGVWTIELRFHLEKDNPACGTSVQDDLWAEVIADASTYEYESEPREQYTISTSAGVLQNELGESAGEIALNPEVVTNDQLTDLVAELTKISRGVDYLTVQTAVTEQVQEGLVIDSPNSAAMQALTQTANFKLDSDGKVERQNEFIQISAVLGQIQFPENQPLMLVVTDTTAQMADVLTQWQEQLLPLRAESIIFDGLEQIKIAQKDETTLVDQPDEIDWQIVIPIIVAAEVVAVGAILLAIRAYRRQNRPLSEDE